MNATIHQTIPSLIAQSSSTRLPQARRERPISGDLLSSQSRARRPFIEAPPEHGIHEWVMREAWGCRKAGKSAPQALAHITSFDGSLRRRLQANEAHNAVERVYSARLEGKGLRKPNRTLDWNEKETTRLHVFHQTTRTCLWQESPVTPDEGLTQPIILDALFPDSEGLICVGSTQCKFHTGPRSEQEDLENCQFVVPAYMTSRQGMTLDGNPSMHSKANTGPRRFIVCDFDKPPPDQHPSIIKQLSRFRPLALVVYSGGKSLHAWFPVRSQEEDDLFWKTAITLGADPALWRNPSSFVRLPLGLRDNGKRQEVLYFNPSVMPS